MAAMDALLASLPTLAAVPPTPPPPPQTDEEVLADLRETARGATAEEDEAEGLDVLQRGRGGIAGRWELGGEVGGAEITRAVITITRKSVARVSNAWAARLCESCGLDTGDAKYKAQRNSQWLHNMLHNYQA